jgi:hypothetical protein
MIESHMLSILNIRPVAMATQFRKHKEIRCRFYAQTIATYLRISTMAENEMAAPYANY